MAPLRLERERRRSPHALVTPPLDDVLESLVQGGPGPRRRLPPEVLNDVEVCALMKACGRYAPTDLRNRALIALLYPAGWQINEALNLHLKDLEPGDGGLVGNLASVELARPFDGVAERLDDTRWADRLAQPGRACPTA